MKLFNFQALSLLGILTFVVTTQSWAGEKKHSEEKVVGSIATKGLSIADFPKTAKITSSQASRTATDAVSGNVLSIGLENEDGYLVYAVGVVNPSAGLHEIIVDAGTGKILAQQKKDKDHQSKGRDDDDDEDEDEDDVTKSLGPKDLVTHGSY